LLGETEYLHLQRASLEKQIKQLELGGVVHLVGHKDEAATLLSAFDLFTLTSTTEALPYVLLEAGLAGLPVVASAVGGIPEIVTSMESGILIKPRDPSEIAKTLQFLIKNSEKRRKFASKLKQTVRSDFSTARMVKETMAVYTDAHEVKN
ncbi:MAG: glycosyltransferase family 4 protein, partial [Patescibacteria group bacterium]